MGVAMLSIIYGAFAAMVAYREGPVVDFISYWAAARLTLAGNPALSYDFAAHHAMEATVRPLGRLEMPFSYPPPFLFFVAPFGLLPFWAGLASWLAITGAIYVAAFRRVAPLPYSLAHPSALTNMLIGQNGFLTSAIFVTGTNLLDKRPVLAGAILGLLIIKPQLTPLLPVAVIAGRYWHAIAGAAASMAITLLAALVAFGIGSYAGFIAILPRYVGYLESGATDWAKMASIFTFCRSLGVPETGAYAAHWSIAAIAAALTARAWWLNLDTKVPILASATLLVPPYLWPYDSLLLMIPAGWLISRNRAPWAIAAMWFSCFLPIVRFWKGYSGPNTIPLASMLALYLMHRYATRPEKVRAHSNALTA